VTNESDAPITGASPWQREVAIAAGLLAFGVLALPFAVYLVGERMLGEYGEGAGALDLAESIWLDLVALRPAAWILVLSPYIVIQLARVVRRIWRRKKL
jgi:hypothetical protein